MHGFFSLYDMDYNIDVRTLCLKKKHKRQRILTCDHSHITLLTDTSIFIALRYSVFHVMGNAPNPLNVYTRSY